MKKIICFDVDGTLTEVKSSWQELTRGLELPRERISEIYLRTEDGSMSFDEGERQLKEIFLSCKDANRDHIEHLFEKMPIRAGALELIDHLKSCDYLVYLVSGAIDMYVEMIAEQLKPTGYLAHSSFIFDRSGALCDIDYTSVGCQMDMKVKYLNELANKYSLPVNQIAFAGDSENDLGAFQLTRRGIAVEPFSDVLLPVAWKRVKNLLDIKEIL